MEAVFILQTFIETIRNCCVASEAYCLSTANSDFRPLADQIGKCLESAPQPLPVEGRVGLRDGQNQCAVFVAERRLVDDTRHAYREHMGRSDGRAKDSGPALNPLADEAAKPVGKLSAVILGVLVAVEDR